jgi:hypothetical protein
MSIYQGNVKVGGGSSKTPYQYAVDHGYTGSEYDFYKQLATPYTYSTEDLTAGTSALETGKLYFVYE